MRLILLGPPGSGKGTQANLLSQRNHLEHIGTGDIIRAAMRMGTPAGKLAKPYVETGLLVPDELVNDLIAERFALASRPQRFVLDGYPRTRAQAVALDGVLAPHGLGVTDVLLLQVEHAEIVRRLNGRWSCPKPGCLRTYHTESNPPLVPGICDRCETVLVQREDDSEAVILKRLAAFDLASAPLVEYYRDNDYHWIDGDRSTEAVAAQLLSIVRARSVGKAKKTKLEKAQAAA